jgi:type I restriction enzyme M protein
MTAVDIALARIDAGTLRRLSHGLRAAPLDLDLPRSQILSSRTRSKQPSTLDRAPLRSPTSSSAARRSSSPTLPPIRTRHALLSGLAEDVEKYFAREVLPHAADAWIYHEKTKVGYEIPFNRHFYVFRPPRALSEIDAELKVVTDRILEMIGGLSS